MADFMGQKRRYHYNCKSGHHGYRPYKGEATENVTVQANGEADTDDKRGGDAYVLDFFWASINVVFALEKVLTINVTIIVGAISLICHNLLLTLCAGNIDSWA